MSSRLSRFKVMTITEAAAQRVREIVAKSEKPVAGLRVGVRNGGCAGMSYTMELAESVEPLGNTDFVRTGKRDAFRLRTVAQRRIDQPYRFHGDPNQHCP